ncbi:MAG: TrmB family transcriptional regulator [Nanoarchaeota archaeon]|nr:TrmB family transcriptional regulator [Nanoarchaeota archaeon]
MDTKKLAELKHVFNINLYEVKLWTALLCEGTASASKLAELSNVPRSRTYDVLETLEKRGFVVVKLGKPIEYVAVPPEDIVEKVKKEIENEKETKLTAAEKIRNTEIFKELTQQYKQSNLINVDLTQPIAIKGRRNIYSKLANMILKSQKNVLIVSDEKGIIRKIYELNDALIKAKENGVNIKIASKLSRKNDKIKKIRNLFEVKDIKNVDMRFVIVDDHVALFTHASDEIPHSNETCVIMKSAFMGKALKNILF